MRFAARLSRTMVTLASGAMMLQMGGCTAGEIPFFDIIQTALLGVTAAGALAILQNV